MAGNVRVEKEGALGWVVFDHLERHNALTLEMWRQIPACVRELEEDAAIRVLILRGAGDAAFVAGADISEFEKSRTAENRELYDQVNTAAYDAIARAQKPVLAMVHGFCIGGGLAIALEADLRYGADDTRMGIPAAKLALGYSLPGIEALVNVVGYAQAKEILFTAKRFHAEEALRLGLLNAVFPKALLEQEVRSLALSIAQNAPLTIRSVKLAVSELQKPADERDLTAVEQAISACFGSEDYAEGVRAFLEKRAARFQGR